MMSAGGIAGSSSSWIPTLDEGIQQVNNIAHNWDPVMVSQENEMESWTPVTPRIPIPQRSNMIEVDMQGNQMENGNWLDLIGIYRDLLQGETLDLNVYQDLNPISPPPVVQSSASHDWVANTTNKDLILTPSPDDSSNQASSLLSYFYANDDAFSYCNEQLPTTGDSSSAILITQKEHMSLEGNTQCVDLNKTPEQKTPPKRKKHRPKVVKEWNCGMTPKPKDPKKNTSGKATVKRKYVKKKGIEVCESQQEKGVDQNGLNGVPKKRKYVRKKGTDNLENHQKDNVNEVSKKPCKRRLNFDLHGINLNVDPQETEQERIINSILNSIPEQDDLRNGNNQGNQHFQGGIGNFAIQTCYTSTNFERVRVPIQQSTTQSSTTRGMLNSNDIKGQKGPFFDHINPWNANAIAMDSILMYQKLSLGLPSSPTQGHDIVSVSTVSSWNPPSKNQSDAIRGHQRSHTVKEQRRKRKVEGWIDDLISKFEGLHIYNENEKGNHALVLYKGERGIVPFEGIKKRKPRPKVDLDQETERVWKLLMGKEGSEGTETVDDESTEKWWEDERRVFRGRVDSFIARMHLVQGDRRFSQWKGSVVDSVIGVFLTQNVTDHLSSSAFMSLAAKFPLKSTTNQTSCQDGTSVASKDTIDSIDSSTIPSINGIMSSSGSNSEPEDQTTGFETSKESSIPLCTSSNSVTTETYHMSNVTSQQNHASTEPISKSRKVIIDENKKEIDWDSLRKQVLSNGEKRERGNNAADSIDYETMRHAHVNTISDAIRERGMNNMLADRMKDFLNRLVRDHGSIDLEWLRDIPPDKAKDYLLSIRGLGLKSVECVRLLSLHHLAFPVDTNVGRIAVRLDWVPLQPLPESLQLHLLEMYPVLESIQKYLWPRLCKLDQLTLYELHYQMITFGKVFCTKNKPNCNACPMRAECRHFASAFASARLALPGPEENRIVTSNTPITTHTALHVSSIPMPIPMALPQSEGYFGNSSAPIIEEPTTPEPEPEPEPEPVELSIKDIEDQYYEDSEDIPTIKLNMEEFTMNLQNVMQEELQGDMSKALVALTPEAASIPTPKLKNISRLRTEHQVYELPDSHPLLEGFDKRESDDPSPYLLSIWTPGETANSTQLPERGCPDQESCKLCDRATCFSCKGKKEANSQVVRGTILIPCRTATRGSFPLNGTYFQVNEVFADHASSLDPIDVPRSWIWNLPRRTVYFGTSVSTIFKGLTTEGIQYCFWRGFVCVRGFDQKTWAPRPLMARLHFPASKMAKRKHTDEQLNKDKPPA